jgi:hypothetical protein
MEVEPFSTYNLGYAARMQGMRQEENPFPSVGEWHKSWLKGWQHCDEELRPKRIPHPKTITLKLIRQHERNKDAG